MIFDVRDYYQLYKISRLIDLGEFKDIDFTTQTFFQYLIDRFDKDKIKVFVNIENKEMNGFVICSLSQDVVTQRPEVFIDLSWVKKGTDGNIGKELLQKVEDYARELKLSRISGFTLRDEQVAMFRKYGFSKYSIIMVKNLDGKERIAEVEAEAEPKAEEKLKAKTLSHKEKCKEYYKRNRSKVLQKRKQDYQMKKLKNLDKNEKIMEV